jgi:hypothetical protein
MLAHRPFETQTKGTRLLTASKVSSSYRTMKEEEEDA